MNFRINTKIGLMFLQMITDTGHSFDALLLYGHEFSLTIFDVLVFSFVDLLVQDYLVAAIITYFVGKVRTITYDIIQFRIKTRIVYIYIYVCMYVYVYTHSTTFFRS